LKRITGSLEGYQTQWHRRLAASAARLLLTSLFPRCESALRKEKAMDSNLSKFYGNAIIKAVG